LSTPDIRHILAPGNTAKREIDMSTDDPKQVVGSLEAQWKQLRQELLVMTKRVSEKERAQAAAAKARYRQRKADGLIVVLVELNADDVVLLPNILKHLPNPARILK